jgi:ribosome-associated toxin RatA of RatAB toxin-antitoxin module
MSALLALALVSGITVGRAPDGRGARVEVSAIVDAPLAAVEAVLLDLEHYPSWFPGMNAARLASPRVLDALFQLPWPLKTIRERIVFERRRVGGVGGQIEVSWRQDTGDFARDEGRWVLTALSNKRTAIRYEALLGFRRWVPNWLLRKAERRTAPKMMNALEQRARIVVRCAAIPVPSGC